MEIYQRKFKESPIIKNIDKIKKNIGDIIFDHISKLNKNQLEKQLESLKQEIKLALHLYGKNERYNSLKEEEFYILYRLERTDEFEQ